jgi:uncharacterized protein (TIGR03118 family)
MPLWTRLHRIFPARRIRSAGPRWFRPVLECLEERTVPSAPNDFTQVFLASDLPNVARIQDPNLVNPWGLATSPTGPFWFAENGAGVSDILDGEGEIVPLVVGVPSSTGSNGSLTGTVYNGGPGFVISANGVSKPATFLFATEDGSILGWNGYVNLNAVVEVVDNSASGASYKGLALATNPAGQTFLYAANFASGTIDVFDQNFKPVERAGAFQDPNLPAGFAPYNVQNIGNLLYVAYAQQDWADGDAAAGPGLGFIDVYNTNGDLLRRLVSGGMLNAPWGMTLAPADFGSFGGALLVGNNGDGRINAYNPVTGAFLGQLADGNGAPITIPTLWALTFGNGYAGGNASTLFFTAGLDYESHGLFGAIQPPQLKGADTGGTGVFNPNAPGEARDYPLPPFAGPSLADPGSAVQTSLLLPLNGSSLAVVPTLTTAAPSSAPVSTTAPAISLNPSVAAALFASATTLLVPAGDDSPAKPEARGNAVALNNFLDLHMGPTDMEPMKVDPDEAATSAASLAAQQEQSESLFNHAPAAVAQGAQEDQASANPAARGDDDDDDEQSDSRTAQLTRLLLAIAAPLLYSYWTRQRRDSLLKDDEESFS